MQLQKDLRESVRNNCKSCDVGVGHGYFIPKGKHSNQQIEVYIASGLCWACYTTKNKLEIKEHMDWQAWISGMLWGFIMSFLVIFLLLKLGVI